MGWGGWVGWCGVWWDRVGYSRGRGRLGYGYGRGRVW